MPADHPWRAVWNRQLHRVLGTGVGLLLAWALFLLPLNPWTISLTMMALSREPCSVPMSIGDPDLMHFLRRKERSC